MINWNKYTAKNIISISDIEIETWNGTTEYIDSWFETATDDLSTFNYEEHLVCLLSALEISTAADFSAMSFSTTSDYEPYGICVDFDPDKRLHCVLRINNKRVEGQDLREMLPHIEPANDDTIYWHTVKDEDGTIVCEMPSYFPMELESVLEVFGFELTGSMSITIKAVVQEV